MNGEMTVTQHNEQLILQKQNLMSQLDSERNQLGLIIGGIMRQMKRKTIHLKPEHITVPGVHLNFEEDGSVHIAFQQPNPNGVRDEQPSSPTT